MTQTEKNNFARYLLSVFESILRLVQAGLMDPTEGIDMILQLKRKYESEEEE